MELLRAGVDISIIALWLGHESIKTTQVYLPAHLALKEAALARVKPFRGTCMPDIGARLRRCAIPGPP